MRRHTYVLASELGKASALWVVQKCHLTEGPCKHIRHQSRWSAWELMGSGAYNRRGEVRDVRPSNWGWVSKVHRGMPSYPFTALTPFILPFCPLGFPSRCPQEHGDMHSGKCLARRLTLSYCRPMFSSTSRWELCTYMV